MSELEYSNQYAQWLTAAGITPNTNPINLRGVVHQILENLGGGGGGAVSSVFGRTGAVTATSGDYAVAQVTGALATTGNGSSLTGITQSQVSGSQAGPLTGDVTTSGAAATLVATTNVGNIITANTTVAGALQKSDNLHSVADAGTSRFNLSLPAVSAVAAVAVANVSLSAPGATLDGYTLLTNDEILLTAQSTSSQNGVWIWSGASSALVRPNEFPSGGVVKRGRTALVVNGSVYANTHWNLAAPNAGLTIDTTAQVWTALSITGSTANEAIIRANDPSQLAPFSANVNANGFNFSNLAPAILAAQVPTVGQLAGLQLPYVVSGCVWTADSSGSSLNGSMTAGTVMIKGILLTVAAVTAHAFTANNEAYVDLKDNGDGTANITYTSAPNLTMSPALAGGGTVLNTVRVAIISTSTVLTTGVNSIIQGGSSSALGINMWTATVAAGSNGNPINTSTLSVTITAGACPTGGGECTIAHASGQTYTITFTSASATTGTITLSGVVVVSGTTSNTVSTGDVVKGVGVVGVADLLGNRIFPTSPGPSGMVGNSFSLAAYTNTLTSGNNPIPNFATPFIVPPGPARLVKVTLNVATVVSSAAAGSKITTILYIGNPAAGTTVATSITFVAVASDGMSLCLVGAVQLAAGSYTAQVGATQNAAGTFTFGSTLVTSQILVELV